MTKPSMKPVKTAGGKPANKPMPKSTVTKGKQGC